jgi:hypothetical protein
MGIVTEGVVIGVGIDGAGCGITLWGGTMVVGVCVNA